MPAVYDDIGLKFVYPENWTLSYMDQEMVEEEGDVAVTFETPGGAFLSINRYLAAPLTARLLEAAVEGIEKEFRDVERLPMPVAEGPIGELMNCDSVAPNEEGIEVNFFVLDLIVSVRLIAIPHRKGTYLIHLQAELKEFEELEMVFAAILKQLRESLDADAGELTD